jgi:hypothetical protein
MHRKAEEEGALVFAPGIDVAVDAGKPTSYGPIPRIDRHIDDHLHDADPRRSAS